MALLLGCIGAVAWSARRRLTGVTVVALAYAALALCLGTASWVDRWAFARLTAPVLAFAILACATSRSRAAIVPSYAAVLLTLLAPIMVI